MARVRLGAVGYLNARPLVYGLERSDRFDLRFDVPSRCAELLHAGATDLGLVPSIEYLRGPEPYWIVPGPAITSRGPVASVSLYTTRPIRDVRTIALDTSSRTSVALVRVLCAREFRIAPRLVPHGPDLPAMLAACDAALVIGDLALFEESAVEKIDLGEAWTKATGLPFVYAFWSGRPDAVTAIDVRELQDARDQGAAHPGEVARAYFRDAPARQDVGERYLRDNIRYHLGVEERAALERFYRYAAEAGVVAGVDDLRFYQETDRSAGHGGA
jgi:chorismate dehydratase